MLKNKKIVCLLIVLCLVLSVMTACTTTKVVDNSKQTPTTSGNQSADQNTSDGAKEKKTLFDQTFKFSYMYPTHTSYKDDNMFEKELDKMLNTEIEYIRVPSANYKDKLNLTLVSGSLPDLVVMQPNSPHITNQWIEQGALVELDEYLEQYGPDIKKAQSSIDPKYLKSFIDGKQYVFFTASPLSEASTLVIREDWLTKLGLKKPQTLDEWVSTLTEFKNQDPAGGGNTIPWAGSINPFFEAYGIMCTKDGRWTETDDGNIISRYEHPNYKEALQKVAELFKEGIIDPETYTRGSTAVNELFYNGKAGATFTAAQRAMEYTKQLITIDENGFYNAIEPMKGKYGHQMILGRDAIGNGVAITKDAKDIPNLMKYLNWTFSEEGAKIVNFGIEGIHYDEVNGKPVLKKEYCDFNKLWPEGVCIVYKGIPWLRDLFLQVSLVGKNVEELSKVEKIFYDGLFVNTQYLYNPYPVIVTETDSAKGADIWSNLKSDEAKVISGQISIDDFFTSLNKYKNSALDQITKEYQEIWKKINAK